MFWLTVDRNSSIPMIRQIYGEIRKRILSGKMVSGEKLPSSRELSSQLHISRNVVLEAYDLLFAEGFLETKKGAGTFVASGAQYSQKSNIQIPEIDSISMGYDSKPGVINFRAGTPDLKHFPHKIWKMLYRNLLDEPLEDILAYGHPEGRIELRQAICSYVVKQRDVICHPEQILITAGTTQAIGLICKLLLQQKKDIVVEDPITRDIKYITNEHGSIVHSVAVDNDGIVTDDLPAHVDPSFIYVTPSHQFPIGGTLPIQRRIELLEYAEETKAYIIEDDYDSEFRYDGAPLSSLHGLSPEQVIYIGTFSKTLCPALRIGYIILPPELIKNGRNRKWHSDLHNEVTSQLVLASFIDEGYYLRHVSRMKKLYRTKRDLVLKQIDHYFGKKATLLGSANGLHICVRFKGIQFTQPFLDSIEQKGAKFYSVTMHCLNPQEYRDTLLIGFGNISEDDIEKGFTLLKNEIG